jgi:succinate dehydrogenase / fumarate reductase flavoprotein subunit
MQLDAKIPSGQLSKKWTEYKNLQKLISPNNKQKLEIIIVGTGLAGASAAASWQNLVLMSRYSVIKIVLAEHIA